jgi:predicted metal-binding membrane protein
MTDTAVQGSSFLSPGRGLFRLLARPKIVALACVVALADLGWAYLGLMVAGTVHPGEAATLGPGMGLFDLVAGSGMGDLGRALAEALCRSSFDAAGGAFGVAEFTLALLMWIAMVLAMMLPTAGPMVLTYAEIAETAAARREPVASPLTLTAGYTVVWLGFALAATLLQWGLARLTLLDPAMASASGLFSGVIFIGAGAYQFSALKHACLTRCQRPFPYLFANWTTASARVLGLGLRQGLDCLGCCWALMLVMFAVGLMNLVWMAALGLIMAAEKMTTRAWFSRVVGFVFLGVGAVFLASAVVAHWPAG